MWNWKIPLGRKTFREILIFWERNYFLRGCSSAGVWYSPWRNNNPSESRLPGRLEPWNAERVPSESSRRLILFSVFLAAEPRSSLCSSLCWREAWPAAPRQTGPGWRTKYSLTSLRLHWLLGLPGTNQPAPSGCFCLLERFLVSCCPPGSDIINIITVHWAHTKTWGLIGHSLNLVPDPFRLVVFTVGIIQPADAEDIRQEGLQAGVVVAGEGGGRGVGGGEGQDTDIAWQVLEHRAGLAGLQIEQDLLVSLLLLHHLQCRLQGLGWQKVVGKGDHAKGSVISEVNKNWRWTD